MRAAILAGIALGLLAQPAYRLSVAMRWLPGEGGTAGYRLYARALPDAFATPTDVGVPAAESDGSLRYVLKGLGNDQSWAFAVSAYGADGSESALSNEVQIGSGGGPCSLTTSRFAVKQVGPTRRLVVRAAFAAASTDASDVTVTVSADGTPLLTETVTTSAIGARRTRLRYRAPESQRAAAVAGIRRLVLRSHGDRTTVTLAAALGDGGNPSVPGTIRWSLQVGGDCPRSNDLVCVAGRHGRLRCAQPHQSGLLPTGTRSSARRPGPSAPHPPRRPT